LRGDWHRASASDLLLLRKAIKEDWLVPLECRGPLLEAAASPLHREDTPTRMTLAVIRLLLAADRHNLKLEEAECRAALSVPITADEPLTVIPDP
jgi:hypothetical protein